MAPPKRPGPGDDASRSKRTKSNVLPLFASSSSSSSAAISEPLIGGGKHTGIGRLLGLSREEEHLGRSARSFFPAGLPEFVHPERARILTDDGTPHRTIAAPNVEGANCVVYWMSRDQRAEDNWALLYAGACARQLGGEGGNGLPLVVCFNLVPHFAGAGLRQYQFMIEGLQETEKKLRANNIPFVLLQGNDPASAVADFATASSSAASSSSSSSSSSSASVSSGDPPQCLGGFRAAAVFTDMSPLRVPMQWANDCAGLLAARGVPLVQVDAANVVPVWVASEKQEVGARTIRRKIHAHLPRYLTTAPPALDADAAQHAHLPSAQSSSSSSAAVRAMMPPSTVDWDGVLSSLSASLDRAVAPVSWARGGETAAKEQLEAFLERRLRYYDEQRNDPTVVFSDPTETTAKTTSTRRNPSATSDLSPWLKFGHLSAQRAVLETKKAAASPGPGSGGAKSKGKDGFIEEGVVRRELSDNFCFYNERYDTISDGGAANWAAQSLLEHASDEREFLYDEATLEAAKTHDDLWNAAQMQMVREGKMHGFLRMYWAKKILEWTASPDEALRIAIHLNDKYELDGRSPNGYVGCMWSIAGVHDMGWKERPIFGKIRYMNYAGCSRKFDVQAFVSRYDPEASGNARAAGGTPAKPKKSRAKKSPSRKSSKVSE